MQADATVVLERIRALSHRFAEERLERMQRRELDRADYALLTEASLHLTGVPSEFGGVWAGMKETARPFCEIFRVLAHGDPSVSAASRSRNSSIH